MIPNIKEENKLFGQGYKYIAGIDEAGRGPIAGPVVAGVVVFEQKGLKKWLKIGIKDSKLLSSKKRAEVFEIIKKRALAWSSGAIRQDIIDKKNIRRATILAMKKAVKSLNLKPDFLLIDGKWTLTDFPYPQKAIANADKKCLSVAAASIVAKQTRDDIMRHWNLKYPQYNFAQHKGYGTKQHFRKIAEYGPCPIHRLSFSPFRKHKTSQR